MGGFLEAPGTKTKTFFSIAPSTNSVLRIGSQAFSFMVRLLTT